MTKIRSVMNIYEMRGMILDKLTDTGKAMVSTADMFKRVTDTTAELVKTLDEIEMNDGQTARGK